MSDACDRVAITVAAAVDLEDLVGYIADRNPLAAERIRESITGGVHPAGAAVPSTRRASGHVAFGGAVVATSSAQYAKPKRELRAELSLVCLARGPVPGDAHPVTQYAHLRMSVVVVERHIVSAPVVGNVPRRARRRRQVARAHPRDAGVLRPSGHPHRFG